MRGRAFVPGHITGFFEIVEHPEPLFMGSRGCGVVIDKGMTTTVEVEEAPVPSLEVVFNGARCDCPVTRSAVELLVGLPENRAINVRHEAQLPLKYGFGMSAAGAIGVALALNQALDLGMTKEECGQAAHRAEVLNMTGLGDVIAELNGGLVLRVKPGAPGVGATEKIPCKDYVVAFLVGEELETKRVLLDADKRRRINESGRSSMELFTENPVPENFMRASKRFALDSGLMSEKVYLAVRKFEKQGVIAGMAMLGNAVFTLTEDPEGVKELLDYPCIIAKIDNKGARRT